MPVLRLQQPRPARRHRRGALPRRLSARASAFRFPYVRPGRHQHLLRRRHTLLDAPRYRVGDPRRHRGPLAFARRCGDHARSQSHKCRGRELRRLSIGRRQPAVARRAGARRPKPQGARPPAHGGRSAGRAGARQTPFRSRVVRPDLCARGTDGDCLGSGATPRARPCRRPPFALSAHHRGRHAVRGASCGRLAAHPGRRAGERALWPDPGALRGGGPPGL